MDVLTLLNEVNEALDKAEKPQAKDKLQATLDEMVLLNKQLVKALERDIKVDNKIDVPSPNISVNVPEAKIENIINPVLTNKPSSMEYKVIRNKHGFIDRVESKPK